MVSGGSHGRVAQAARRLHRMARVRARAEPDALDPRAAKERRASSGSAWRSLCAANAATYAVPRSSRAQRSRKQPTCRHFPQWRDPDSNRGHHDFQAAAKARTTGAVCRGLPELRGVGDAGGFQAIPVALGHRAGGGDPIVRQTLARKRAGSMTAIPLSCASSRSRSSETIASTFVARASATR
jgi:hypothetical protein